MLQKLASLNPTPTIALNEASELLQKHLSVGLCRYAKAGLPVTLGNVKFLSFKT